LFLYFTNFYTCHYWFYLLQCFLQLLSWMSKLFLLAFFISNISICDTASLWGTPWVAFY
jgi:hypothetical protein